MEQKTIDEIINTSLFIDGDINYPDPLITIDGKTILTENNFITISGLPKSRKTTFMQFFIASALTNSTIIKINTNLPKGSKIILIDTEQSIFDFHKQNMFLKRMLQKNKLPEQIKSYLFRQYEPDTILQAIEKIAETEKPKIIFIDNLTELSINPNDIAEAKKVIHFLKRITQKYNCGIVCLLHLSKSNSFTLGNLGSYADRGAQSVLKVSIDKDTQTSTIECTMLRSDAHFDPISIQYNEDTKKYDMANPPGEPETKRKFSMDNFTIDEMTARVSIIYDQQTEYTYAPLVTALGGIFGKGQTITKQTIIPYLIFKKILITKEGIYTFYATEANSSKGKRGTKK